jgi:hypothetical protein
MSAYNPPIEQLPIFDTNAFTNANEGNGALVSEYLKFPIAQGVETFPSGLIGNLTGSLTSTTNTDLRISTTTGTNRINFNNTGTTGNICYMNSAGLTMASNKIITGNLTGSASKVVIGNKTDDINYNLIFSNDYGSSQNLYMDGGFNLQYNPSTDTITTSNLYISNIKNNDELSFELVNVGESFRFLIAGNEKLNINNTLISTSTNMYVEGNLQNSFLSAIVGNGAFFIDGDTDGGDIVITAKTSTSKTIIQTEGGGGVLTTCATFENGGITGNLNGNASSVTITSDNGNGNYYIPFTKTSGTGSRTLFMDDTLPALTYSPNNNLLTVRNIEGTTLTASNDFDMTIATATGTKKIYFNNTGTTGNICYMDSGGIQMAIGKYLTGYVIGDVTGVCSKLLLTSSSSNIEYNVPFTSGVGGGSGGDFYIDSSFNIKYNPSTNKLNIDSGTISVGDALFNDIGTRNLTGGDLKITGTTTAGISGNGNIIINSPIGNIQFQNSGLGIATINSNGITMLNNKVVTGNLTGISSKLSLATKSDNVEYNIPFTSAVAGGGGDFFIDSSLNITYNPSTNNLTTPNMIVSNNLQNSYLSAIVGGGAFYIDGDTAGGDIVITTKSSTSKVIIQTEGVGGALTNCAIFENGGITGIASKSKIVINESNIDYSIPFTFPENETANWYVDGGFNLKYNPVTNQLQVPNIQVGSLYNYSSMIFNTTDTESIYYFNIGEDGSGNPIPRLTISTTNISAGNGVKFYGDLEGTSAEIKITSDNSTGTFYIPYAKTSGTGSKELFIDDVTGPLTYNPNTQLMTANITGTSALATQVTVSALVTDGNYYPTFVTNTGSRGIAIDNTTNADYRYNPSTNTLTARNILGNTLYSLSTVDLNIATTNIGNSIRFNGTTSTNNICYMDSTGLTMASGKIITGNLTGNVTGNVTGNLTGNVTGNLTGNVTGTSSNITTTITSSNFTYNIPFTNNDATGSSSLYIDTGLNLNYNPSTDTLSVPSINAGLLKNSGDVTLQTGTNTDFINFNVGTTRYMSISPTEIRARAGAKFVGDLTGQINDLLGADTYTSNVTLSSPNYSRISYFVGTSNFDIILSNSPTPPNGSAFYIVFKIPDTGTLYSLTVYDGSVSSTTKVNKFIGQNGDKIGGKFLYYTGVGWFSLSGSF